MFRISVYAIATMWWGWAVSPEAHGNWIQYNGSEYKRTSTSLTWAMAEAEALGLGGHLVAVNDQAEQNFLATNFPTFRSWIGLNDATTEGVFVWSNGDPFLFSNWAPGEPNNQGNEDFVIMEPGAGYRWNDGNGADRFLGIIERPLPRQNVPVPGPESLPLFAAILVSAVWTCRSRSRADVEARRGVCPSK